MSPDPRAHPESHPPAERSGASSDGDQSWTEDPQTQDPEIDRSVDAVIERTAAPDD